MKPSFCPWVASRVAYNPASSSQLLRGSRLAVHRAFGTILKLKSLLRGTNLSTLGRKRAWRGSGFMMCMVQGSGVVIWGFWFRIWALGIRD